ncbi:PLP-dependent aminotransferase family protein [Paraburkholderia xenovorans]|uniref:aminotransferase-like domain-containing protein n=1 Tax=Paraburkholderia xenovorans TaxID=36873 RepID=UPI0038BAB12E
MKAAHTQYEAPHWFTGFASGHGPIYLQIVEFLESAIANGSLSPGDRLPPQRQLAETLKVDLTTVTRGFTEARRRHLIEARGALGTFIAAPKVDLTHRIDLSMNIPPSPADVDMAGMLKHGASQILMRSDVDLLMTYHLGGGSSADRDAGAHWLKRMLGRVDTSRVIACPGAQSTLAALILASTRPGDVILTEPLIYPGLPEAAIQLGRRVETVEVDASGMRPDCLEDACRTYDARLIYLNPTLQNPTARTMPEERRRDIVRSAARCKVKIIEDDPYWLFSNDAPPPLARLMPEQVYYLSTLSKCISPGLRTAFLRLPTGESESRILSALHTFSAASPLTTALATQWIHDGSADQLLAGVLRESHERQRVATDTLTGTSPESAGSGIHLWYPLPRFWKAEELSAAAHCAGLLVTPSREFYLGSNPPNAIRISLGGCASRKQLAAALKKLSNLLTHSSPHYAGVTA